MSRLEPGSARTRVACVQAEAHTALFVQAGGRAPVNITGTDHARASADQRVADAAVLIAVSADSQECTVIQDEHGHSRSRGGKGSCHDAGIGRLHLTSYHRG